jgi:nitrate reductase gamma subunit
MSIGTGVFLIVVGAILAFAVDVEVAWADLDLIGYILIGAGAVVFIIGLVMLARRRRTDVVTRTHADAAGGEQVTRTTRADDPDVR